MTVLMNEYVDTIAREERHRAAEVRKAKRAAAPTFARSSQPTEGKGLTAIALVILTVLLVAAVGVNVTAAPILGWILLLALVATSMYTAAQLTEMFGTNDSIQE